MDTINNKNDELRIKLKPAYDFFIALVKFSVKWTQRIVIGYPIMVFWAILYSSSDLQGNAVEFTAMNVVEFATGDLMISLAACAFLIAYFVEFAIKGKA